MSKKTYILGVILAGGQSRRMGADKASVELSGVRLADFVYARINRYVNQTVTNAAEPLINNVENIPDNIPDLKGPLAGLIAAFVWSKENLVSPYAIVTVAVDMPFFPDELISKLSSSGKASIAIFNGEIQPTFGFWPENSLNALEIYTKEHKNPSIRNFCKLHNVQKVIFQDENAFFNINTPTDLKKAEKLAKKIFL